MADSSNTPIQNISGSFSHNIKSGGILKPGEFVFVRILSSMGKNKYSASFAGNRFSVTSQTPLEVGKSFSAQIQVKDGMIFLVPNFTNEISVTDQTFSIQNYLMALGLPNDNFSQQIIQLFVGMGLKFDSKLEKKIRSIAAKFPGREKEAAEVALAISEKGINPEIESVMAMLSLLLGQSLDSKTHNSNLHEKTKYSKEELEAKHILSNIYDDPQEIEERKKGLLTLFNHIKNKKDHWIVFPIKLDIQTPKGKDKIEGNGSLRILINLESKKTEYFKLSLHFSRKTYFVMLKYNKVKFCTFPEVPQKYRKKHIDLLASLTNISTDSISYDSKLADHGFFTETCAIPIVRTEA